MVGTIPLSAAGGLVRDTDSLSAFLTNLRGWRVMESLGATPGTGTTASTAGTSGLAGATAFCKLTSALFSKRRPVASWMPRDDADRVPGGEPGEVSSASLLVGVRRRRSILLFLEGERGEGKAGIGIACDGSPKRDEESLSSDPSCESHDDARLREGGPGSATVTTGAALASRSSGTPKKDDTMSRADAWLLIPK